LGSFGMRKRSVRSFGSSLVHHWVRLATSAPRSSAHPTPGAGNAGSDV
jgi:hypothetical protein